MATGLVVVEFVWHHSIAHPRIPPTRLLGTSGTAIFLYVRSNSLFFSNFVAMATRVGRCKIWLSFKLVSFFTFISYRRFVVTKSLSPAIFEIIGTKHIGSRPLLFTVTWRHRSRDHLILASKCIGVTTLTFHVYVTSSVTWQFDSQVPISYRRSIVTKCYLQPFSRYWPLSVLGSRPWPSRVAWRHRSRDHWIRGGPFPIGGPLDPSLYL